MIDIVKINKAIKKAMLPTKTILEFNDIVYYIPADDLSNLEDLCDDYIKASKNKEDKVEINKIKTDLENVLNNVVNAYSTNPKNKIIVKDNNVEFYINKYILPLTLDQILSICKYKLSNDYEAKGASFILPNGKFLNVADNITDYKYNTHYDLVKDILYKILKTKFKDIEFNDIYIDCNYLMSTLTDYYGVVRINSGNTECEDRFYMVLPEYSHRPTQSQFDSIIKFLDWGAEANIGYVTVFIGDNDNNDSGKLSLVDNTVDDMIKILKRSYVSKRLYENLDKETQEKLENQLGYSYKEALKTIEYQIEAILNYNGMDINITGLEFTGSRVFGNPREDSDLDMVMTYEGNEKEDDVFNALHDEDDPIMLDDYVIDINPIKEGDIDYIISQDKNYKKNTNKSIEKDESQVLYHGSSELFDKFKMPINWLSTNEEYSEEYAKWLGKEHAYLYYCKTNIKNPIDVGNTSEPLFNLIPVVPPYKLSEASKKICKQLNIDDGELIKLANNTSAGSDQKKQYKLKLHTITRLPEFKELAVKAGFDGIKAIEAGNVCYGVFNPDNIEIIDVVDLNDKTKTEDYPEPKKLYSIKDKKATWDSDAQDYIWWDSESKYNDRYAKCYKCTMSPKDFLDLTTSNGAASLKKGGSLGLGKLRDLDVDEFNKEKRQPIFLIIEFDKITSADIYAKKYKADVVGHEGRHRMFALMQSGVEEVDVQLKVYGEYDKYKPYEVKELELTGQFNQNAKVTIYDPIIMSWEKHKELNPSLSEAISDSISLAGTSIEDFDSLIQNSKEESLNEKIEKHDILNPKLWNEDQTLKPEVVDKIKQIVQYFVDSLKEDGIKLKVKDIVLVGSNCSYNYNDQSDLDIHIIADPKDIECPKQYLDKLYSAYRSIFNKNLDIDFYGIPIELYIEMP